MALMSEQEIAKAYCTLMQEARTRLEVIRHISQNDAKFPTPIVREICYLQLRLLCEIVAVCCLVAHGDVGTTRALRKTYEPRKIIDKLGQLNPNFYPQPINQTTTDYGTHKGHRIEPTPNAEHLTKQELVRLWDRCGDVLHRSPMVKAIKLQRFDSHDAADIRTWFTKILGLLDHHWITLIPNEKGLMASFASVEAPNATISFLEFSNTGIVSVRTTYIS